MHSAYNALSLSRYGYGVLTIPLQNKEHSMKRFLALSTLAAFTAGVAGSAMARDNAVAISVGIPGQVYMSAQSENHAHAGRQDVHREQVYQPRSHGAENRHQQVIMPVHARHSARHGERYSPREQRHDDHGRRGHEGRKAHHDH